MASQTFNLPPGLLSAVCWVESTHNPIALNVEDGGSPSRGVCQVKESTARHLGFTGPAHKLMDPSENTHYAAKYLRLQLDRYGDTLQAVAAYNAGSYRADKNGHPRNRAYVRKVFKAWAEGK